MCHLSGFYGDFSVDRTTETNVYDIAVSLAERYKIPLWKIYMTHLEYLFESG